MKSELISIDVQGSSIDEAIKQGLEELGLTKNEVDIEIIEPGSKGLFGIGSRDAHVRLKVRQPKPEKEEIKDVSTPASPMRHS